MKPDFVDWEIVLTRLGFSQMQTVRIWCMPRWLAVIVITALCALVGICALEGSP